MDQYIADVVCKLPVHQKCDWNDDWRTRGCVAESWQQWCNSNKTISNYL